MIPRSRRLAVQVGMLSLMGLLASCASHRYLGSQGHQSFERGDYAAAAATFAKEALKPGANQILFLLDQGLANFYNRDFEKAISVFLKAADLVEIKDFTSISEEVGTLATSDNVRAYKGEDFEKVLIHFYLALAFAALDQTESAQVEARRINQLLYRMIHEGKRNYQESPAARYLSAMLWEQSRDWNSAYVDYKKTFELEPKFPGLGEDLMAMANRLGFRDEEQKWRQEFPGVSPRRLPKGFGELVLLVESGRSPVKVPRDENSSLPKFVRRWSAPVSGPLMINGVALPPPQLIMDIEDLSIRYLEDRMSRLAAAKLAGTAAKGALAYGLGKATKNEDLGWIAFAILSATDQADLRSWKSLPARMEMIRMPHPEGNVELVIPSSRGEIRIPNIVIKAQKKTFVPVRR